MLKKCIKCGTKPTIKQVGDYKRGLIFICPKCGYTPARTCEMRFLYIDAAEIWNRRN